MSINQNYSVPISSYLFSAFSFTQTYRQAYSVVSIKKISASSNWWELCLSVCFLIILYYQNTSLLITYFPL